MNIVTFILVVLAAFAAGIINAVAGGGTFITFPALTQLAGLSAKAANMTSTLGVWPGSATAILAARSEFKLIPRFTLIYFSLISLVGGTAGSILLVSTSSQTFAYVIPWLLAFATLIFAAAPAIGRWAGHQHGERTLKWTLIVTVIQLAVAVYGGYFGAGIGVLMLAGLSFCGLDNLHQINGLKVLLATIINGISIVVFILYSTQVAVVTDRVDWPLALGMALAAAVGGFVGMRLARRFKPANLRYLILAIGTLLTVGYFYKSYFAAG